MHYEKVAKFGVVELSPKQAELAILLLKKEEKLTALFRPLHEIAKEKMVKAIEDTDPATYLLWWIQRQKFTA